MRWVSCAALALLLPACDSCSSCSSRTHPEPASSTAPEPEPQSAPAPLPLPASAASTESEPDVDASLPPSDVRLVDAGRAPRRRLRYAFRVAQGETLDLEMKNDAPSGSGSPPTAMPQRLHVVLAIDPIEIAPDGAATCQWTVTSIEATPEPGSPAAMAAAMGADARGATGQTGKVVFAADGTSRGLQIRAQSPLVQSLVSRALVAASVPVPAQAIGAGARWERTVKSSQGGMQESEKDTFTLDRIDGDRGSVRVEVAQTSGSGEGEGMSGQIASSSAGSGSFDLARVIASRRTTGAMAVTMSRFHEGSETDRTTVQRKTEMTVTGALR